jgi:hypothetical protein
MSKAKFKNKLIEVLESRYLEPDGIDKSKMRGRLMTINHSSYVPFSPKEIAPMADRLVGIICKKENAARLLEYRQEGVKKERKDSILAELFPTREIFPEGAPIKKIADEVVEVTLGVMAMKQFSGLVVAVPEGVIEPTTATAAAADTPHSL